ncbi:hypothetical protein DPX16_8189 [Anabarilius grahami]|uniref:Uncharacterized protein n=1 Tax=Anabarilius grahami TaxID=495550 RepID=A0A3N0Y972_ANAGA|nr:hypothetical protein DPX16_8189 [Anabarilius grahami]
MVGVNEEDSGITTCMPTPHVPGPIHSEDVLTLEPSQPSNTSIVDILPEPTTDIEPEPEPEPTSMPEPMPDPNITPEPEPN